MEISTSFFLVFSWWPSFADGLVRWHALALIHLAGFLSAHHSSLVNRHLAVALDQGIELRSKDTAGHPFYL